MVSFRKLISLLLVAAMLFSLSCEAFAVNAGDEEGSFEDDPAPAGSGSVLTLPAALEVIEEEAFYGDESLEEVVLPYGATTIGPRAFADSGVKNIYIPDTVTEIAEDAFEGIADLTINSSQSAVSAREFAAAHGYHWINNAVDKEVSSFEDSYDAWDYEEDDEDLGVLLLENLTLSYISADDFDNLSEAEAAFIAEYNDMIAEYERGYAAYQEEIARLEEAFSSLSDSISGTTVEGTENGVIITNDYMVFSTDPEDIESPSSQFSVNSTYNLLQSYSADSGKGSTEDIDEFTWQDILSTCSDINNAQSVFLSACEGLKQTSLAWIDAIDTKTNTLKHSLSDLKGAPNYALLEKATNYEMGKLITQKNKIKDVIIENVETCIKWAKDFHLKLVGWSYSIGADSAYWFYLNKIQNDDPHPTDREMLDTIRMKYALLLNEEIDDAKKAYSRDALFNLGCIVVEIAIFGKGAPLKMIGKYISKQSFKLFGKKWVRSKWAVEIAANLALSSINNGDTHRKKAENIDNLLHGRKKAKLTVRVLDKNSRMPLKGALVQIDDSTQYTADDGTCQLLVTIGDYSGEYTTRASHEGYADGSDDIIIDAHSSDDDYILSDYEQEILLEPAHTLYGVVRDSNLRTPLSAVTVTLDIGDGKIFSTKTDENGYYFFPDVPFGMHILSFEKEHYQMLPLVPVTMNIVGDTEFNMSMSQLDNVDPEFWAWCVMHYDQNQDSTLSREEILAVTKIDINGLGFSSLNGIQNFSNLTSLNCSFNELTSLDLSGCSALTYLGCWANQLTSLNLSGCYALTYLDCRENQLTSLDLSGCYALTTLLCHHNQLTSLNLSGCSELRWLGCQYNQLTTLDLSSCPKLKPDPKYVLQLYCDPGVKIIR